MNYFQGRNRGFAADIDAFLQKGLPKIKEKGNINEEEKKQWQNAIQ